MWGGLEKLEVKNRVLRYVLNCNVSKEKPVRHKVYIVGESMNLKLEQRVKQFAFDGEFV